jgi:uncharacterized repeat protein (TIGR03803 family)
MRSAVIRREMCSRNSTAEPRLRSRKLARAMRGVLTLSVVSALLLIGAQTALAAEKVLHSFMGSPDGANPAGSTPVLGSNGNLYGTTLTGGAYNLGSVWMVTPSGTEAILHSFNADGTDGYTPAAVVLDNNGNLFGTTASGGAYGLGTVFKMTPSGTETILWNFGSGTDGSTPGAGPTLDGKGNLYGTTTAGGAYGLGTVWELTTSGTETILWSFGNGKDASTPEAGVALDKNGNLYGTTFAGGTGVGTGCQSNGCGTVWKLTPSGTETVLYSFDPQNGVDGFLPDAAVVFDDKGNLYSTCHTGGADSGGTLWEVSASGTETILWSFGSGEVAVEPYAGVVFDKNGNLYGTTYLGGVDHGDGAVYELTASGAYRLLHGFTSTGNDGFGPTATVVMDEKGNLFGVTNHGGAYGNGTVYEITPYSTLSIPVTGTPSHHA